MEDVSFTPEEQKILNEKIQRYVADELGQEIGRFEAQFLLDFITREIGAYYYNRGLYDAQAILAKRFDDLRDAVYQLERSTEFTR